MELNFNFDAPKPTGPPTTEHAGSKSTSAPKPAEVVESTPFDKFDLATVEKEDSFLVVKQKIKDMESKATDLVVVDDGTFKTGMEMLVQLGALDKVADNFKKNHSLFKVIAQFKNGFDKLIRENVKQKTQAMRDLISPKISFYQKTQAELQRKKDAKKAEDDAKIARAEAAGKAEAEKETQEKAQQDAKDLQAELNIDADNSGVGRVSVPIPEVSKALDIPVFMAPVTQKSEKIETDHGTAKIESIWIVKVTDPEKVDRRYCSPDLKKLDIAVQCGVRKIDGCIVEESFDPKIRLSKGQKAKDINFEL